MNIGSLFISLGVKANTRELTNFNVGIKNIVKNTAILGGAITGAVYSLKKFVESGNAAAYSIVNFNRQTGLSIDKLNQFKSVGKNLSGNFDVENITSDIMNLEKTLTRIRLGQGSIKPFQMLGIDVIGKDAFGVLEQLRNNIRGLGDATATVLLEDLGLNPNFLQILKLSNAEFNKLSKNNFLSLGQAKTIENLNTKMKSLSQAFINFKNQAIVKIAPALTDLINKTFKWMTANNRQIVDFISSVAKGFGMFITAIGRAVGLVGDFANKMVGVDKSLKILAVALGAATLAGRPLLLGLTALLLILEDIAVWKMGGKSLFGDLYKKIAKIPNIDKILGGVGALFVISRLTGGFKGLLGILTGVVGKLGAVIIALTQLREIGDWVKDFFSGPFGKIAKVFAEIGIGAGAGFLAGGTPGAIAGAAYGLAPSLMKAGELYKTAEEQSYGLLGDFRRSYKGEASSNNIKSENNLNITIQNHGGNGDDIVEKIKNASDGFFKSTINGFNKLY